MKISGAHGINTKYFVACLLLLVQKVRDTASVNQAAYIRLLGKLRCRQMKYFGKVTVC